MKNKILRLQINDNYKIITISDIHGHLDVLKSLLQNADLQYDDILIIIGDFINKGPDNIETLRYMMELIQRPNTYILKGNHESFICHHIFTGEYIDRFLCFIKQDIFRTVIHEMAEAIGFDLYGCNDGHKLSDVMLANFKDEFEFMHTLPVILFADDFIFVHGGYDEDVDIALDEGKLLKFDNYNELSSINKSKVIVGHWPTANMRSDVNTNVPLFNDEKNIISIDGGIGVKTSGELNALIIEKKNGDINIDYIQENHFIRKVIKESHTFREEEKFFVNYPHFDIEILEQGPVTSRCRHLQSGKELSIFNSLLDMDGDVPQVKTTYINHFINLQAGDEVEVCMEYDDCILVKHKGEFGWILKKQI